MIRETVKVENKLGLHARAAAKLVQLASAYRSQIHISRVGAHQRIDSKSILGVLMLAAAQGTTLILFIDGDDEEEAARALRQLFEERFGEKS